MNKCKTFNIVLFRAKKILACKFDFVLWTSPKKKHLNSRKFLLIVIWNNNKKKTIRKTSGSYAI